MNAKRLFGNEDLQLVEFAKKIQLELGNESGAAARAEVENADNDDEIEIKPAAALPDSLKREVALQRSQTMEPIQQAALQAAKSIVGDRPPLIVSQRQIKIVPASRFRHGSGPLSNHWAEARFRTEVSCGAGRS